MEHDPQPRPTALVIFGGRGDLTWRKLVPALFNLHLDRRLPEPLAIVAVDRVDSDDVAFRERLRDGVNQFSRRLPPSEAAWESFAAAVRYQRADFDDPAAYAELAVRLDQIDAKWSIKADRVFYLATPPALFGVIARHLGEAGLAQDADRAGSWSKSRLATI